jgi:hypothetical protein
MSTEPTPNPPANPETPVPIPPIPDAEAKLRAIAEKQGTLGKATFENLLGAGRDLWDSPEDFERFLELLREIRHAKG